MTGPLRHSYAFPRPALTVDIVVLDAARGGLGAPAILLIQRRNPPFQGCWALPGGFVDEGEPLEVAAARELEEETGVEGAAMTQVGAYGDPGRDPRGWTVSVAFRAVVPRAEAQVRAGDDASRAEWFRLGELPPLAFDHARIIEDAVRG